MACLQSTGLMQSMSSLSSCHAALAGTESKSLVAAPSQRRPSSLKQSSVRQWVPSGRCTRRKPGLSLIVAQAEPEVREKDGEPSTSSAGSTSPAGAASTKTRAEEDALAKELSKAVRKTATTFAPRASTKQKNPAVPGSTLYTVFEVQAYISMALGGLLSYNLLFPSNEPDIWRLMGMWSVWMFTIPSLRARDCSANEKEALNYLFLLVPLVNVTLPLVWKSFAAVWSADVIAFVAMYAWKMQWLGEQAKEDQS